MEGIKLVKRFFEYSISPALHLCRQLSASAMQTTEMGQVDQDLSRQLRQHSLSASLDTHTLRIRKMSLDNR